MAIRWLNIAEMGLSQVPRAAGSAAARAGAPSDAARWRAVAGSWRAGVMLVALCLAVYLPGLWSIPAVDRDEARFAQASRQMFEAAAFRTAAPERFNPSFHDGGWAIPKIQDRERLSKPPLVYWLQVASAWLFTGGDPLRDAIWMYRVPSLLAAIATVLLTWRLGCSMFDPRAAWLAGALLAVAPMVVWDAHQARADSVMTAFTTAAMLCLWRVWRRRRASGADAEKVQSSKFKVQSKPAGRRLPIGSVGWPVCFWLFLSAAIMTKGFIPLLVIGLTALFLSWSTRNWRWLLSLRPLLGLIILAAVITPWLYAVGQHKGGLGAYLAVIWEEFFLRGITGSREGHFAPPGTHTLLLAVLFWPGSLLTLAGFVRAWRRAKGSPERKLGQEALPATPIARIFEALRSALTTPWHDNPTDLFLIAWIVPAWIVFELSPAKLPHYTMPMLPAVALLSARVIMGAQSLSSLIPRASLIAWIAIGVLPFGLLFFTGFGSFHLGSFAVGLMISAVLIAALYAALAPLRSQALNTQFIGVVAATVLMFVAMQLASAFAPGSTTSRIAEALEHWDPTRGRPIGSAYREDSMVFATRGRVERIRDDQIDLWLQANPRGIAIAPLEIGEELPPSRRRLSIVKNVELGKGPVYWDLLEIAP